MGDPYIGEIRRFAFQSIPQGWLPCDGRTLLVSQEYSLFAVLQHVYGGKDTTFQLPDLRGRTPIQWGGAPGPVGAQGPGTGPAESYFTLVYAICREGVYPNRGEATS